MSDNLYVRISIKNAALQHAAYWWPLIFEAMRQANFQFYPPENIEKQGKYFSFDPEIDEVTCTFQELWHALHSPEKLPIVYFWPSDKNIEPFYIDATARSGEDGEWHLDVTIPDGFLPRKDPARIRYRLNALLQVGLALYELCLPCDIRMYWDETYWSKTYTDLLQTRTGDEEHALEPLPFSNHLLHWKEKACIQQHHIYITDPLPIHAWGNCFRFVSLFSDATMTANFEEKK